MTGFPAYEVYAIKYAETRRVPGDAFLSGDPHDAPRHMDYFIWLIRGNGLEILVDTGFGEEAAQRRKRMLTIGVEEALAQIGVEASTVQTVIITHLHYDHAGNLPLFPAARFHLQDSEMNGATGRLMTNPLLNSNYDVEDVCTMVRRVYAGRVTFHDGEGQIAPGISVHRIGGHTLGLMAVRVSTKRGAIVLASDAMHYYATRERRDPFPVPLDIGAAFDAFDQLDALATSPDHVIPGHDPLVASRYPALDGLEIFALHEEPGRT